MLAPQAQITFGGRHFQQTFNGCPVVFALYVRGTGFVTPPVTHNALLRGIPGRSIPLRIRDQSIRVRSCPRVFVAVERMRCPRKASFRIVPSSELSPPIASITTSSASRVV